MSTIKAVLLTTQGVFIQIEKKNEYCREFAPKYFNQQYFECYTFHHCKNYTNIFMIMGEEPIGAVNKKASKLLDHGYDIEGDVVFEKCDDDGVPIDLTLKELFKVIGNRVVKTVSAEKK